MCGKSSKFWNTIPIRERSLERSVFGSATEMPSTAISPFWKGSSPFTHLMSVDLPLPEGPHTTTTSPLETSVEQSVRTWNCPYHLLTFLMEIMRRPYLMTAIFACSCFTTSDRLKEMMKYTTATNE